MGNSPDDACLRGGKQTQIHTSNQTTSIGIHKQQTAINNKQTTTTTNSISA
jgi:hypothetical protein